MKTGIILFIIGLVLLTLLLRVDINKIVIKNIAVAIAVLLSLYGVVLMVQPSEDKYFEYTKTTVTNVGKLNEK